MSEQSPISDMNVPNANKDDKHPQNYWTNQTLSCGRKFNVGSLTRVVRLITQLFQHQQLNVSE